MSTAVTSLAPAAPLLNLLGVSKAFEAKGDTTQALDDVSFSVQRGQFVSLIGPSGCGKSTILNLTAGLMAADEGEVAFDGRTVGGPNRRVGYMTQDDALFGWRNLLDNVALPLEIQRIARPQRHARAAEMLARVGLAGFERHYPNQLSGGMRKRVSLARTLIYSPEFLLLDEPLGALDAQTRLVMQLELRRLVDALGLTVMLVTHDLHEAITLSDRILVFSKRPAQLIHELQVPRTGDQPPAQDVQTALYAQLWQWLTPEQEHIHD